MDGYASCLGSAELTAGLLRAFSTASPDPSLPIVLGSGGSIAMVWGLIVSALGTLAMGVSLAEVCHVLPLSGGQYDWACELQCVDLS